MSPIDGQSIFVLKCLFKNSKRALCDYFHPHLLHTHLPIADSIALEFFLFWLVGGLVMDSVLFFIFVLVFFLGGVRSRFVFQPMMGETSRFKPCICSANGS